MRSRVFRSRNRFPKQLYAQVFETLSHGKGKALFAVTDSLLPEDRTIKLRLNQRRDSLCVWEVSVRTNVSGRSNRVVSRHRVFTRPLFGHGQEISIFQLLFSKRTIPATCAARLTNDDNGPPLTLSHVSRVFRETFPVYRLF